MTNKGTCGQVDTTQVLFALFLIALVSSADRDTPRWLRILVRLIRRTKSCYLNAVNGRGL